MRKRQAVPILHGVALETPPPPLSCEPSSLALSQEPLASPAFTLAGSSLSQAEQPRGEGEGEDGGEGQGTGPVPAWKLWASFLAFAFAALFRVKPSNCNSSKRAAARGSQAAAAEGVGGNLGQDVRTQLRAVLVQRPAMRYGGSGGGKTGGDGGGSSTGG
jgi:hypothetical protein